MREVIRDSNEWKALPLQYQLSATPHVYLYTCVCGSDYYMNADVCHTLYATNLHITGATPVTDDSICKYTTFWWGFDLAVDPAGVSKLVDKIAKSWRWVGYWRRWLACYWHRRLI
jgi:hypothetical protein